MAIDRKTEHPFIKEFERLSNTGRYNLLAHTLNNFREGADQKLIDNLDILIRRYLDRAERDYDDWREGCEDGFDFTKEEKKSSKLSKEEKDLFGYAGFELLSVALADKREKESEFVPKCNIMERNITSRRVLDKLPDIKPWKVPGNNFISPGKFVCNLGLDFDVPGVENFKGIRVDIRYKFRPEVFFVFKDGTYGYAIASRLKPLELVARRLCKQLGVRYISNVNQKSI